MRWHLTALLLLGSATLLPAQQLTLNKGDHISFIGNTLAERMQHHGWLETLLTARHSELDLSFRNLGFSGDELTLRLRSAGFGSPDSWLTKTKTDVIFAFFGYNESYGGKEGLEKFTKDLDSFVESTLKQKYNGTSAPRLVLFSPIAHEDHKSPHLPDGKANNERLKLYTEAMATVAKKHKVGFVDLFAPSQELYATSKQPLTINGIHLKEAGDRLLAEVIERALFGGNYQQNGARLAKIHAAVLERNFYWFNRYRTVDGYSIFGGRADLRFNETGLKKINTNREVAQREMEILDVMTANRDKLVWAVAQGKDFKVDDSNAPPFVEIRTNKPGPLEGGKHLYLSGEEAITKMKLGSGLNINLFADEKMFPEIANPVQMTWDSKGRLWVAVMPSYPHWKPNEVMDDKIVILEDTDGDGKADKSTIFADKLHVPTGLELWNGGVLVGQQPDLMFLKDTDGDGKADYRERVLHGIDSADTHHALNSFVFDGGGALYFQEGTFHHTQVETPYGPPVRNANAGVYRYEPRTSKFETYVGYSFANPHGHVFDHWGQDFVTDGTGAVNYFATAFSGYLDFPHHHPGMKAFFPQRTRPCPGTEILSSRHFPAEFQGNYLIANVIGVLGILRYKMVDEGSGFGATELEPMVTSSDPNFRPSAMSIGPDGALYFTDWQNPIIGHMQHNLRDPSRGRTHGRVYRITHEQGQKITPAKIDGEPIAKLLDLLKSPEYRVRYRARIELGGRKTADVLAEAEKWLAKLDKTDVEYQHHVLEGLWLYQNLDVVNVDLLKRVLTSPEFRARAAATKVLCYWRDRVPEALELLKKQAADSYPRVRLEAVRAASFFKVPEAVEILLIANEHPTDYYLTYTGKESMRVLEPMWKAAVAQGKAINVTTDAGARFFLRNIAVEQLLKMKRTREVTRELLLRGGLRDEQRREALSQLAKLEEKAEMAVLLEAIDRIDKRQEDRDTTVVFDLMRLLSMRGASELTKARAELEKLATAAKQPEIRQIALVSLINVDHSTEKVWAYASKSVPALRDLLSAMPLIADPGLRASLYPKVAPLLHGLPPELAPKTSGKGVHGRYVRIEIKARATLTLAEVEVYSDGQNIARKGKASQVNTAFGGEASRAIDGNKNGTYGAGTSTHTMEPTPTPWWEVDLGGEHPLDRIDIYNRTDAGLGKRLEGYSVVVLDAARKEVFRKDGNPAPAVFAKHEMEGVSPVIVVRRAAMQALTSVRGEEEKTFKTLAGFLKKNDEGLAALRAMQRIPKAHWPKEEAGALLDVLLASIKRIPTSERTSPAALDALQFADTLATLLPLAEARKIRKELGELGVRVIRLGTLPERMSYDKEILVVQAGKAVEFLFENIDLMPHNFVITQPGAMQAIGEAAEATATNPDAAARHYVPQSDKILLASILLQPRDMQKLSWTAPTKPGVYPYVCTYPGHWRRMYGALYVVADMEEYLANPDAYIAKAQLPIADELLKDRRPRTEWKVDDLATAVKEMKAGRSHGNGKRMFTVASCVACHKLENIGQVFGPELKLDPKLTPVDVLRDIIEPSHKINEKFQTYTFETKAGKVITGLIVEDLPDAFKIIENPLVKAEPVLLKKKDIDAQTKSPVSIMPKGLLDKLTRDEILDLLAYVLAQGSKEHPLFKGDGHHDHGSGGHQESRLRQVPEHAAPASGETALREQALMQVRPHHGELCRPKAAASALASITATPSGAWCCTAAIQEPRLC